MNILNITQKAADRVISLTKKDNKHLRLSVVKSGCAGFGYDLTLVDEPGPNDEHVTDHGAEIFIDPQSLFAVFGTTIDWKEDKFQQTFTFENPAEASKCGCGASFSV